MKHVKKPVFFVVSIFIVVFTLLAFVGIHSQFGDIKTTYIKGAGDIRWGIDIRGGVDVTFAPAEGIDADNDQVDAVQQVIEQRLIALGVTDYEVYPDYKKDQVIVRFPWKTDEANFDPETAVKELGETALLTFREGNSVDELGLPTGVTAENIILQGRDVLRASPMVDSDNQYIVSLELSTGGEDSGASKFAAATEKLYNQSPRGVISIWMDDTMISYPQVNAVISDGKATISGGFTADEVKALADKINGGALPFKLETRSFRTISPTLGMGARDAMALAGLISLILVVIFMVSYYRIPGTVASIALIGQVTFSIAAITGFFGFMNSFTLTIPGIAGIILSIGMGVDANIITAERIREELDAGKTIDGALRAGYTRAFSAILDGNVTVIIVAAILMGAFGPPESWFSKLLSPFFFAFSVTTAGTVYSFGYTLLLGVIANFVMGVTASRLMLMSLSRFKKLRNPKLYGGANNA